MFLQWIELVWLYFLLCSRWFHILLLMVSHNEFIECGFSPRNPEDYMPYKMFLWFCSQSLNLSSNGPLFFQLDEVWLTNPLVLVQGLKLLKATRVGVIAWKNFTLLLEFVSDYLHSWYMIDHWQHNFLPWSMSFVEV